MSVPNEKTALIAMSGGVDSSVAACLMQSQGYDCLGVTMRLFRNPDIGRSSAHPCCSQEDIDDAAEVLTVDGKATDYELFKADDSDAVHNVADKFFRKKSMPQN